MEEVIVYHHTYNTFLFIPFDLLLDVPRQCRRRAQPANLAQRFLDGYVYCHALQACLFIKYSDSGPEYVEKEPQQISQTTLKFQQSNNRDNKASQSSDDGN